MEILWGNLLHSSTIFSMQKKAIRIREGCGNRISCRNLFKKLQILPLTSQYMLSLLMFVVQNKNLFSTNIENHNIDTRLIPASSKLNHLSKRSLIFRGKNL
jgi:hypothetical protein